MERMHDYHTEVTRLMQRLIDEEASSIEAAADAVAASIADDRLVHVLGAGGHSVMGAEEVFYRAGGLVPINAILDEGLMLGVGAVRSTNIERTPGYARAILDYHGVGNGDVLIIVNAYGINAVTIDIAILGSGQVQGASTPQGGAEFKACVNRVVRGVHFPSFGAARMGSRYRFNAR